MIAGDSGASQPAVDAPPAERPGPPLTLLDRLVRVPLGFLWLVVLVSLAVPACLFMTILYYVVQGFHLLAGRGRPSRRKFRVTP